jgi:8-oxo-dGTP diphosphatase/2-hydroxy-dATP diphosphatase
MKQTTLIFLYNAESTHKGTQQILLAMKKRGFGAGRWNGVGGKLNDGEGIREAAVREAEEEIGVKIIPENLESVAILDFSFENKPDWNQQVHVFFTTEWEGEPAESEEMKPEWFAVQDIPFSDMWPDDIFWLPLVLEGEGVRAQFTFGENDVILEQQVDVVDRKSL